MSRHSSSRGFSLIEVVVSIFVIGSILVASTMLLQATKMNRITRDEDIALKIASNEIEAVRAGGYAAVPASGPFTDTDLSALTAGTATITVMSYDEKTKNVSVLVSWLGPDQATHTATLTTLITQTGGLP